MSTTAQAIKAWEAKNEGQSAAEATVVKLYAQIPPITKLDASLNSLVECEHLSLSTNAIDKMVPLNGMPKLKILSIGRNQLKKIEKLEDVSDTLEELWISYNKITTLDGLSMCTKLRTLYIGNNEIKSWEELDKLACLPDLKDILLFGNPLYDNMSKEDARIEVLKHLPNLGKIDGDLVTPVEREQATG